MEFHLLPAYFTKKIKDVPVAITMGLYCQLESEKNIESKWLDFTHFRPNAIFLVCTCVKMQIFNQKIIFAH